jgi:hypothetical protein
MTDRNDYQTAFVRERAPEDEPELTRAFDAAVRERAFWETQAARLTRRFPEQFVVVIDSGADDRRGQPVATVGGTAVDLAGVEALHRRFLAEGVPAGRLWVRFLSPSARRLILH